jgi:hypothetical protein
MHPLETVLRSCLGRSTTKCEYDNPRAVFCENDVLFGNRDFDCSFRVVIDTLELNVLSSPAFDTLP